jgi:peptide/nickel transport system permease protein
MAVTVDQAPAPRRGSTARSRTFSITRRYIVPRLLTLLAISLITFAATDALGIDVARKALGREVSPAQLHAFNVEHGLNRPAPVRYLAWLGNFVRGDWGTSPLTGEPIRPIIVPRFEHTLILAVLSLLLALPISLAIGIWLAKRARTKKDLYSSIATVALASIPVFGIGIVLVLVFAVNLGWAPVDSTAITFGTTKEKIEAYILPTATLVLSLLPHFIRMTRAAVRETLTAPYAQAAVLRGLPRRTVTWRHLMPNAAGPIVNVVALEIMWLVGGVILVENVFGFPGLGALLVDAIEAGDLISVQAIAILTGVMFITISLAADLFVLALNPRLRRPS